MDENKEKIIQFLIERGYELFKEPYKGYYFTESPDADRLISDLNNFPHILVLCCVMD